MITRRAALGELTLFLVLAFSFIWLWAHTLITGLVIYALGLGLAITTHIIHHETPRELGLRIDNMGPAIKDAAVPVVPIVSSLLLYSFVSGHWSPRALDPQRFIELFCWAFFQQYLLQAFIHRRVAGLVGRPLLRQLLVGAIFASLHVPNPVLMSVTFLAGFVFAVLYSRQPNISVLALCHAVGSTAVAFAFDPQLLHNMRVGPGYLH